MNRLHIRIKPRFKTKFIETSKNIADLEVQRAQLDNLISEKTRNHETALANTFQFPIEEIVRQIGTITHKVYGGDRDRMVLTMIQHFSEDELRETIKLQEGETWEDIREKYSYKGIFAYQHSYAWALVQPSESNRWLVYNNKKRNRWESPAQLHLRAVQDGIRFDGSDVYIPWEILDLNPNEFAQLIRLRCKFVRKYIPITPLGLPSGYTPISTLGRF